jgi:RNA polymerase sigma-70 factor (ECF subfamily)
VNDSFADDEERWATLMAAALRGDAHLYEQLLRELAAVIERYIERRFGALSFIEDCVQECLLAVHTGRHTYDPRRPFRPWFFAIVRNKTIDMLRRSYAGEPRPPDEVVRVQHAPSPDEALAAGQVLSRLTPTFRSALMLTKICGFSLAEAAAHSGISESAMKSRVSRAVRAAEHLLNEERDHP